MAALDARPDLVGRLERITAPTLADQLASGAPPFVLDVRTESEWAESRIEGSVNVPLNHLQERLDEVPRDRPVVVHCATTYRATIAAGLLDLEGFAEISTLVGGIGAWEASRLATSASA